MTTFVAVMLALSLGMLACILRRVVGPLFFYDLVRLARRGRSVLLRCTYGLLFLIVLYLVYHAYFPDYDLFTEPFRPDLSISLSEEAGFAEKFVLAIVALQAAAVVVLTPAYVAGAIAEEKESRTLDLLLTTQVRNHEIVLGKLFARLTHIGGILLVGLPILSLAQMWGGVDIVVLFATFLVTGLSLLSVGSISILCSVLCRGVLSAVVCSYALVLGLGIGCFCQPFSFLASPVSFMTEVDQRLVRVYAETPTTLPAKPDVTTVVSEMVLAYAVVHGLIAVTTIIIAIASVRQPSAHPESLLLAADVPLLYGPPPPPPSVEEVLRGEFRERRLQHRARARPMDPVDLFYRPGPIGAQPLLWKEVHDGMRQSATAPLVDLFVLITLCVLASLVIGVCCLYVSAWSDPGSRGDVGSAIAAPAVEVLLLLVAGVLCLLVAFRAAGTVVRERQRRTWDSLLALPVERTTLLGAKWLGSILRLRPLLYCLAATLAVGVLTGGLHLVSAVLLALVLAAHLAFLVSVGLWLSLGCRKTLWANLGMAVVLLLATLGGPWLRLLLPAPVTGAAEVELHRELLAVVLSPPASWYYLIFPPQSPPALAFPVAISSLLLFGVLAWLIWLDACHRLRQQLRNGVPDSA